MALMVGNHKLAKDICDALGLKYVRDLKLHFPVDGIAMATVEYYPDIDGIKQFPAILKKFELVEIRDDLEETTTLGDEFKTFILKEDKSA